MDAGTLPSRPQCNQAPLVFQELKTRQPRDPKAAAGWHLGTQDSLALRLTTRRGLPLTTAPNPPPPSLPVTIWANLGEDPRSPLARPRSLDSPVFKAASTRSVEGPLGPAVVPHLGKRGSAEFSPTPAPSGPG